MAEKIAAVVFDIGETLVDETRLLGRWADWLNIPRYTFFAVLGARIARGQPTSGFLDPFSPPFEPADELARRRALGQAQDVDDTDLYPDVLPTLRALKESGLRVGAAGNQPPEARVWLDRLEPPLDMVGISELWGVRKPAKQFFAKICEAFDLPATSIAYVGDQLDNDIVPAQAAGMLDIHIKRGPFAYIADSNVTPTHTVTSLAEVLDIVTSNN